MGCNTLGRKPVGPLPAGARAKHGTCLFQICHAVETAAGPGPHGFPRRPVHLVIGGIGLDGALLEIARLRMHRAEAPHVEGPQVHARIAMQDGVGHGEPRPARSGNASREAAGHVEIVEFGCQPHDRLAIGGHRNGPVDHRLNADLVQNRQALGGRKREKLQPLHVGRKKFAPEIEGRHSAMKAPRALLPAADGKGAGIGLQIEILVGIAQRGEAGIEVELLLGQEILVLDDAGGKRHAGHVADPLGPQPGAVDQNIAGNGAAIGDNANCAPAFDDDLLDAHALLRSLRHSSVRPWHRPWSANRDRCSHRPE